MRVYKRHYEKSIAIPAAPTEVFTFINDHKRFSSHMSRSSWMMGGGRMVTTTDEGNSQKVGSHIRLSGSAFGIKLNVEEVVKRYEPPFLKTWETVGNPKLLVIGSYLMGIEIKPQNTNSGLSVFIDYDLPTTNVWMGKLLSRFYAKWCVEQIISGVHSHFIKQKKNDLVNPNLIR